MKKAYLKAKEIEAVKVERKEIREQLGAASARVVEYKGMHEDIMEKKRLEQERDRLIDLEDELKDAGRVA